MLRKIYYLYCNWSSINYIGISNVHPAVRSKVTYLLEAVFGGKPKMPIPADARKGKKWIPLFTIALPWHYYKTRYYNVTTLLN